MEPPPIYLEIARWVRQVLRSGFHLDQAQVAEMEASFGIAQPDDLIAETHASQAASYLDLLFFPDRSIRMAFEEQWGHLNLTHETAQTALDLLQHPPVTAPLHITGRDAPIELKVSGDLLAVFVQRLNMAWHPPQPLRQILQTHLAPSRQPLVRSHLRHARLAWHDNQMAMLDLFLNKFDASRPDFEPSLEFLLSIVDALTPQADRFDFLITTKFFYFQSLCKAEAFERRRQNNSMEILILQGERAAHGSIAEWRQRMRQVDDLCQTLFGQTRFFQAPEARQVELEAVSVQGWMDYLG
jgi:hypothetical protein